MKTCIRLLALTLTLPVFSQTDGDNIVIGKCLKNLNKNIMKKLLLILTFHLFCLSAFTQEQFPSGCSVITISKGGSIFFGGNDDSNNPDQYYWVEPGDSSRYGVIWIGTSR